MLAKLIRGIFSVLILSALLLLLFLGLKYVNFSQVKNIPFSGALDLLNKVQVKIPEEDRADLAEVSMDKSRKIVVKVGLFSDSEGDWKNLEKALNRMEDLTVDVAFFLGDLTRWGSREELLEGKAVLDASNLEIYVMPGDHDLAASVADGDDLGLTFFEEVLGEYNHIYEENGHKFLLFNNSANFSPIPEADFDWFQKEVVDADFVILSQPLYHPVNPRIMGVVDGEIVSNVYSQSQEMLKIIRDSKVKAVIAADQHMFSNSFDPEKTHLRHIVIGALVSNDDELRNPQAPRFSVLEVYSDGIFRINDIVL